MAAAAEAEAQAEEGAGAADDGAEKEGEQERPQFDEEEFLTKWDEDNPPIEIPPEVIDDIDNDYDIPEGAIGGE